MRRAGAAIPEFPGPAHAPDLGGLVPSLDRCGDEHGCDRECDRARNVSSDPMSNGREGNRGLTRLDARALLRRSAAAGRLAAPAPSDLVFDISMLEI